MRLRIRRSQLEARLPQFWVGRVQAMAMALSIATVLAVSACGSPSSRLTPLSRATVRGACSSAGLKVTPTRDEVVASRFLITGFEVQNITKARCTVGGYMNVELLGPNGKGLPFKPLRGGTQFGQPPSPLRVPAGYAASFNLQFDVRQVKDCYQVRTVRLGAPGDIPVETVKIAPDRTAVRACSGGVRVSAVYPPVFRST